MDKKYLMVIDLEATCFERGSEPPEWFQEIIEVGLVLLDSQTLEVVETHQQFVKPVLFPQLSPFCKGLTTIAQSQADGGISFRDEMNYLSELYVEYNRPMFFSFGRYDYNQILRQCNRFKVDFPFTLEKHVNIKQAFNKLYNKNFFRGVPHKYALKFFDVSIEGTHHRALDDALTISKFLVKMVKDGLKYRCTISAQGDIIDLSNQNGGQIMSDTCIHGRTYKQKCAKCFRCVICGKPLNRKYNDYTVDYEGDVAHESCAKEKQIV